jgi:ribosomal protein S12 methylthiotransferase
MRGQVPDRVKRERRDLAMAEQRRVARQLAATQVGRVLRVLVEGLATARDLERAGLSALPSLPNPASRTRDRAARPVGSGRRRAPEGTPPEDATWLTTRGESDAPDIDGRIYCLGHAPVGQFARVRIIGHGDYDLFARPAEPE